MADMKLRPMGTADQSEVADLICVSTNYWYEKHGHGPIFTGGPAATQLFNDVYEALDPGCCIMAEDPDTGRLMGSCYYHPRETHVSLGIMNVHPNYFGRGVARRLLDFVIALADKEGKPIRLVSSAMNLDSFSLYTRAAFVPQAAFQDMFIAVPEDGMKADCPGRVHVREAAAEDAAVMADLEMAVAHIRREKDYAYFIANEAGIWHVSVYDGPEGVEGFLVSVDHPGSNMLGPGIVRNADAAEALILTELDHYAGRSPVFLLPVVEGDLVRRMYGHGARNCEMHFAQIRGDFKAFDGIVMPTFMPETG
jgi:GNAT superfamily N-acetyltransferase